MLVGAGDIQAAGRQRLVSVALSKSRDRKLYLGTAKLPFEGSGRLNIFDTDDILLLDVARKIFRHQDFAAGDDNGPLNHVFQLAHITWPRIRLKRGHSARLDLGHGLLIHLRILLKEMGCNLGDVFQVLLKGRGINPHDIDAVIKVLSEGALGYPLCEVLVGCKYQSCAEWDETIAAEPAELSLLEDAE